MDEVRAVLEWRALNYYPGDRQKEPIAKHMERLGKPMVPPKHSGHAAVLLDVYFATISQRGLDDLDCPVPLTATLLRDYMAVAGVDLTPQDCEVLFECDRVYRATVQSRMIAHRAWLNSQKK